VQRVGVRQGKADKSQRSAMREAIGRRKLEDEYSRFLREMRGEAFVEFRNQPAEAPAAPATPAAPAAPAPATTTPAPQTQQPQPPANGG